MIEPRQGKRGIVYRVKIYDGRAVVANKSFRRRFDAKQWEKNEEERLASGQKGRIQLGQAVSVWLEQTQHKLSPNTLHTRTSQFNKVILPFFGENTFLDDLTVEDVDRLSIHLKDRSSIRRHTTINDYLKSLSAFFGYFIKRRHILNNPVMYAEKLKVEVQSFNFMTLDEKRLFLSHANQKYQGETRWVYVLYLVLLNAGLRWSEAAALQWDTVILPQKYLVIKRTCNKMTKEVHDHVKSGHVRYVGINSELYPELEMLFRKKTSRTLLFPNQIGGILNPENFKRDYFYRDIKACGFRSFRIHDLRHSFASHFMMLGGDIYKLKELLGHSDVKTTQRYAHLCPSSVIHETEILASGIPNASQE